MQSFIQYTILYNPRNLSMSYLQRKLFIRKKTHAIDPAIPVE